MNETVVQRLLATFEVSHDQLDPIYELAKHAREQSHPKLGYFLSQHILGLVAKGRGRLSNLHGVLYELTICCWYAGKVVEGRLACDRLLFDRSVDGGIKGQVHVNSRWYLEPLLVEDSFRVPVVCPLLTDGGPTTSSETWRPLNPGIFRIGDQVVVNCRCVNYNQAGTSYTSLHSDGKIRTRNFLIYCDREWKATRQIEVQDHLEIPRYPKWIEGYEDCRFCVLPTGELVFSSVTFHLTPEYLAQIAVGRVGADGELTSIQRIRGPVPGRCEKNWLPFVYRDELCFIYLYDPFVVLKPLPTGSCDVVHVQPSPVDLSRFRGSAAPIEFDGGLLLIIHEVIFAANSERTYVHRFVWLDLAQTPSIQKISHAWYLREPGIEFCSGMMRVGEDIYVSAGLKDREAWIFRVAVGTVRGMLGVVPG